MVKFFYNDRNQRFKKESYNSSGALLNTTYYVRDLAGSILAVYMKSSLGNADLVESPIYGNGRIGVHKRLGDSYVYELTDHLGNVRTVFSKNGGAANTEGYSDYYPFGMPMPNRNIVGNYRYAFQGQEKDPETGKEAFEARLWDARIARWLTVDPAGEFDSPYLGMGNNPVSTIDPDGRCTTCPDNAKKGDVINHSEHGQLTFDGGNWVNSQGYNQLDGVTVLSNGGSRLPDFQFWYRAESTFGMFGQAATISHFANWTKDTPMHQVRDLVQGANLAVGFTSNADLFMLSASLGSLSGNTINKTGNRSFSYSPRYSPQSISAKYYSPQPNGVSHSYSIINGRISIHGRAVTSGKFDFVINNSGELKIGTGHYYLAGEARSVRMAGRLSIHEGKVKFLNSNSGHYRPTAAQSTIGQRYLNTIINGN